MGAESGAPDPPGGGGDLLADVRWECGAVGAGEAPGPAGLDDLPVRWLAAAVPGTAAGALRAAGRGEPSSDELDGADWWFRCRFSVSAPGRGAGDAGPHLLELGGLATVAEVFLDGELVLASESMFATHRVRRERLAPGDHELALRFAALGPLLRPRRPRPRWKTAGASHQSLRWFRTTLLGRQPGWAVTPAPVGPWRPVRLLSCAGLPLVSRRMLATCPAPGAASAGATTTTGWVAVDVVVATPGPGADGWGMPAGATLEVAGASRALRVSAEEGGRLRLEGSVAVEGVERWWPHTHGTPNRYPVRIVLDGPDGAGPRVLDLGEVGFRTVAARLEDGGFDLAVNGVDVFCRGGCWYPIDPVTLTASDEEVDATLELARQAGMNLVRIPGGTVYEDERFFAACDRLGLLVWQDAMFAFLDPPDDPRFAATVAEEVDEVLATAAAHPCLAVVCGGQELEEQPAMFGLPRDSWTSPVATTVVREAAGRRAPGIPYLPSSPWGGTLPFHPDGGVSHYTGVGVFLRPLDDLRRAAPRFVSEGLAFSIPPSPETVDGACGGARQAGHDPSWKRAIHHDTGGSFDLEDVRNHYVGLLFGEDPAVLRRRDPERALDLGRAAVAHVMEAAAAEWRRPGSPCSGLVLVGLRDLRAGAGWGVLDALGRPKAPWYCLAGALAPVAVLVTDEGLNGLHLHLVNDTAADVAGRIEVALHAADHLAEMAAADVTVPARGSRVLSADGLFDGFRDLTYAYQFGPRAYELVVARLAAPDGTVVAEASYLPGGLVRPIQAQVGLQATLEPADGGAWSLSVQTTAFAQFVSVDIPGFRSDRSWFHLPPGGSVRTLLRPEPPSAGGETSGEPPRGRVRALNAVAEARVHP